MLLKCSCEFGGSEPGRPEHQETISSAEPEFEVSHMAVILVATIA